ncbi:MAG: prepilin-type N-terminal cleavage/methylation domain-containing protein [Sumerlaeia bacterium]
MGILTSNQNKGPRRAFTLIELLIVVAIIAILAAIAVPNFLEAQTRSKVSRVKADMRSVATALESYRVDNNKYPPVPLHSGTAGILRVVPSRLSTPIAYITNANILDPFVSELGDFQSYSAGGTVFNYNSPPSGAADPVYDNEWNDPIAGQRFYYNDNQYQRRTTSFEDVVVPLEGYWTMASLGPDKQRNLEPYALSSGTIDLLTPYDPTNGSVSGGDIIRTQKASDSVLGAN